MQNPHITPKGIKPPTPLPTRRYKYHLITWLKDTLSGDKNPVIRRTFLGRTLKEAVRNSKTNYPRLTSIPHAVVVAAKYKPENYVFSGIAVFAVPPVPETDDVS